MGDRTIPGVTSKECHVRSNADWAFGLQKLKRLPFTKLTGSMYSVKELFQRSYETILNLESREFETEAGGYSKYLEGFS